MTKWEKFKITSKETCKPFDEIIFSLDRAVDYTDNGHFMLYYFIFCVDCHPFSTYQVGDYLEIDVDKTVNYSSGKHFDDTDIVRKFGSSNEIVSRSNNIPSISRNQTLTIGREIDALIDQSGGRNEYEAKMHVDDSNRVSGYSIIGRRSK